MPTELIFVRHGETDWNKAGRIQGLGGPGLNETGFTQAREAAQTIFAESLAGKHVDALYASDLERAHQTAQIIAEALGLPIQLEIRLRERAHGDWQGYTISELEEVAPQWKEIWRGSALDGKAPNGESVREMLARVTPLLDEIAQRHADRCVILVSHGGVIGVMRTLAAGLPHDHVWTHGTKNCEIVSLEWPPKITPDEWMRQSLETNV